MNNSIDLDKLNNFIDQASNAISCDSNCQYDRKSQQLKQDMLNSQINLKTAPNQLENAKKNYFTFVKGESEYNDLLDKELHKNALQITDKTKANFNKQVQLIQTKIDTYDGLSNNIRNINELYIHYKRENDKLKKLLNDTTIDIVTNDRKTFYEEQGINTLHYFYNILRVIYIIVIVSFIISIIFIPSRFNIYMKIIILTFLCVFPFISTKVIDIITWLYFKATSILPKNIHKNL